MLDKSTGASLLATHAWEQLQKIVERFESAWDAGERPNIATFLPDDEDMRRKVLTELIFVDLERRLKANEAIRVETYLTQFPELSQDQPVVLALLGREHELRKRREPNLDVNDYFRRFPAWRADLASRLQTPNAAASLSQTIHTPSTGAGILAVLRDLKLLSEHQVSELRVNTALIHGDPKTLLKHLVLQKLLTPYQANCLSTGKAQSLILGPFLLLERLGEGGMGQVFKARHQLMNRVVAVKVLRDQKTHEPDFIKRFMREIQAASQLSHPNIVTAHDAGQVDGRYYFAMEFVEGIDLAKLVSRRGRLEIGEACDLIRQAARGLQHAHERGMVHRDVKPANLIVTSSGGLLKILDMGLARVHEKRMPSQDANPLTQDGLVMGTPDYMAPEQAMDSHSVDIRADIYSLGCTLFHLLVGQPPYAGGTLGAKIAAHLKGQPPNATAYREQIPVGLSSVIQKMMAGNPNERYQTPAEVAAALAAFAQSPSGVSNEETVIGLPQSPSTELQQAPGREAASDAITGQIPMATLAGVTVPGARKAPSDSLLTTCRRLVVSLSIKVKWRIVILALSAIPVFFVLLVMAALVLWPRKPTAIDLRPEDKLPWYPTELVAVLGEDRGRHWGPVLCLAASSDGSFIASGGSDGMILIWSTKDLRQKGRILDHTGAVRSLAISPDGKRLVSFSSDGTQRLWNIEKLDKPHEIRKFANPVDGALVFTPDGAAIISWNHHQGFQNGYDIHTGLAVPAEKMAQYHRNEPFRHTIQWSINPDTVNKISSHPIHLRYLADPKSEKALRKHTHLRDACMDPASLRVASFGNDKVIFWDGKTGNELDQRDAVQITKVAIAPGGSHVFLAHESGSVEVIDWDSKKAVGRFTAHQGHIHAFAFPANSKRTVVTASADGTLRHWDYEKLEEFQPIQGHVLGVTTLAFSSDGTQVFTGGQDGSARLWTLQKGQVVQKNEVVFRPHNGAVTFADFIPGSSRLLTIDHQADARIWERDGASIHFSFKVKIGTSLATQGKISPDGKWLATREGFMVQLSDNQPKDLTGFRLTLPSLVWAADNKSILAATMPGPLWLWEDKPGAELRKYGGHGAPVRSIILQKPNQAISASEDGHVLFWDLDKKLPTNEKQLQGPLPKAITSMEFSPDGTLLACASNSGQVVIWDIPSGKTRSSWKMPGHINQIVFAPDSTHLGTANSSGTVYLYRLDRKKN